MQEHKTSYGYYSSSWQRRPLRKQDASKEHLQQLLWQLHEKHARTMSASWKPSDNCSEVQTVLHTLQSVRLPVLHLYATMRFP